MTAPDPDYLERLVRELSRLPAETGWVEFKKNNDNPDMIGKTISALSNSAALENQNCGYMVWGIADETHAIVGTDFAPETAKRGNENLEAWLVRLLNPRLAIRFHRIEVDGVQVILLEVPAATGQPTKFNGQEWVRVGPTNQPLGDHGQKEAELWRQFERKPFETLVARADRNAAQVVEMLDYPAYFETLGLPLPVGREAILRKLEEDRLIARNDAGHFDITNLGAILYARRLQDFPGLGRKAVRVIVYDGRDRMPRDRATRRWRGSCGGWASARSAAVVLTRWSPRQSFTSCPRRAGNDRTGRSGWSCLLPGR
ncbi:MAG: putative DNA binding domain-containing protein [Sandarakinorhabdus sp.]|nr:putative DNA binding domain-containing protein [Sandarakinorhabdus sp.]